VARLVGVCAITGALALLLLLDLVLSHPEQAAHRVREPLQAAALVVIV